MKLKIPEWVKDNAEIIFEWAWFIVITILVGIASLWALKYVHIDPEATGNFIAVRIPKIAMNVAALCGIAWLFDLVTPGSHLGRISENAYASAIFMSVLVLSLALVIM